MKGSSLDTNAEIQIQKKLN